jgi:hypothetical protein
VAIFTLLICCAALVRMGTQRPYGHCRHTHIITTMIFTATRNPSRSVIGCNLQVASREYVTLHGGLGRASAEWLDLICDDSPKT